MPLILMAAFAAGWCGLCLLLSQVGGWARLARHYRCRSTAIGLPFRLQSGGMGTVNYNGCLGVQTTMDGLYLSVPWLFRAGHPPLFIPWTDVHKVTVQRLYWWDRMTCEIGSPVIARLHLPKCVFEGRKLQASHGALAPARA